MKETSSLAASLLRRLSAVAVLCGSLAAGPVAAEPPIGNYDLVVTSHTLPVVVPESQGMLMLTVQLQEGPTDCASVWGGVTWMADIDLMAGNADPGDAGPFSTVLNFSDVDNPIVLSIPINQDSNDEQPESFEISLTPVLQTLTCTNPVGDYEPNLLDYRFQVIIDDDDPDIQWTVVDLQQPEGDAGSPNAEITVQITNGPLDEDVTIDWNAIDGSAEVNIDYLPAGGTVTIPEGSTMAKALIPVVGDTDPEPDENFFINVFNPSQGNVADGTAEITILDDDTVGMPQLAVADIAVAEGDAGSQIVGVKVFLVDGPTTNDVDFDWTTFDGTALANDGDYQSALGSATLFAGQAEKIIDVTVNGDTTVEPDEFFEFKLLGAVGADILDPKAEVTILDDDGLDLRLRVLDTQAVEGDAGLQAMQFTVEVVDQNADLASKTLPTFSVDYTTVPRTGTGIATEGVDYQPASGTLSFTDDSDKTITVNVIGDTLDEPGESITLRLLNPVNVTIEDGEAAGLIVDDDNTTGELSISDAVVDEGDEGDSTMTFEVMLAPAQPSQVRVSFETRDDTANAGSDYRAAQGSLVFAPGETVKTVSVPVIGDTEAEGDEAFEVQLFNAIGAQLVDGVGEGRILDDDGGSTLPTLDVGDATVIEGDAGTTTVELEVSLSAPSDGEVTASFATADGTATAGSDYQAREGTVTLQPGETRTTLTVTVVGDLLEEGDESFTVLLIEPQGAQIGDGEGTVTILDDDQEEPPPVLSIENVRLREGNQGTTNAVFTLRLAERAKARIMVDFTTRDGTALASDNDYVPVSGRLDFDAGESSITLEVPVVGDTRAEDDEVFFVDLSSPDGAVLGNATARCVIVDDDEGGGGPGGSPGFFRLVPAQPAMEGAGPATIQVERFGGNAGAASVQVTTVAGSATAGSDFQGVSQRLQWQNGQSGPLSLQVPILNDGVQEPTEAFGVILQGPQGASISTPNQVTVQIVDDDTPMRLEAVGETERTTTVRTEEDFQVRVLTEGGAPVEGAVVVWATEGRARIQGDGRSPTDGDGVSTRTVLFAERPGPALVAARLLGTDLTVAFAVRVEGDLGDNLGGADDGAINEEGVARSLDDSCAGAEEGSVHGQLCDYIFDLASTGDQREVLEELTPRAALAQARAAVRAPAQQYRNIGARLSVLRGGGAGSAFSQLAFAVQGDGVALGPLQQAIVDYRAEDAIFDEALERAVGAHRQEGPWEVRGGAASGDDDSDGLDPYDSTESPWGFFMNGRASFGDAPRRGVDPGYDFSTQGLTAGVDYRGDGWIAGASLGYTRSDNDLDGRQGGDGGSLDSTGTSLSVFGSVYRESFYVDGIVTFGRSDFEIERVIDLPVRLDGLDRFVAEADPDGDELSVYLGFGYDFLIGDALTLTGFLNGQYVRATVDSYRESGAEFFGLTFEEQELESLLAELGLEISYPVSVSWGVLQPSARVSFLREFEDDPQIVRARFTRDPTGRQFVISSERPDRSYLNVALGLTATLQKGWASYLQFDTDLEREDLDIYTLAGGFRFQF